MTEQEQYRECIRWREGCAVKPYTTLSGTIIGLGDDILGFLHDGKADLISLCRLSFASELMVLAADSGAELEIKVRG